MTRIALLTALATSAMLACGSDPESPGRLIRAMVARGETAAEAKDLAALRELVSPRYTDEHDNDRRTVMALVGAHLVRNRAVHLVTRVAGVTLRSPERADVVVLAAMAGRPGDSFDDLRRIRADVYRFDLVVATDENGSWLVERAAWRPADLRDLRTLGAAAVAG
jgi:hypothetical protein